MAAALKGSIGRINNLQNANGNNVYLATLTVSGATDNSTRFIAAGYGVSSVANNYGVNDVVTRDSGKVYFYLPENLPFVAVATPGDTIYFNSGVAVNTSHTAAYTLSTVGVTSPTLYPAMLNVLKDGTSWNSHNRFLIVPGLALQNKNSGTVTAKTFVSGGSFAIYDGGVNTGVTIAAGGSATLNYYDVTYDGSSQTTGSVPAVAQYFVWVQVIVSGNTGNLAKADLAFGRRWTASGGSSGVKLWSRICASSPIEGRLRAVRAA
jgi:hypothetical protein